MAKDYRTPELQLGGQALIEGVMMRSPHYVAAAVRRADGSIETRLEEFHSVIRDRPWLGLPFLRGVVGLFEMLALGMRYLNWSSSRAMLDSPPAKRSKDAACTAERKALTEEETGAGATSPVPVAAEVTSADGKPMPWWAFLLTVCASLGMGFLLFVALPNVLADLTLARYTENRIVLNLFEGALKLIIFVGYVWIIGRRQHVRRVFEYHGAEHKVVYAAENGCPISPDGARPFDTPHPRCGTGFALLTVLVSVVCFAFLPWTQSHLPRVFMRLALMPVVAGVSYEIIKMTVNPQWRRLAVLIVTPGMWLQRLTTREPDDSQLEVSCAAMQAVIDAEHNLAMRQIEP